MNTIIIISVILGALLIFGCVMVVYFLLRKKKITNSEKRTEQIVSEKASTLAAKLGNNDNIEKIDNNGSRVTVYVKDMSKVNKDEINQVLDNTMYMNNKIVFIIGTHGEEFKKLLEENISKLNNKN